MAIKVIGLVQDLLTDHLINNITSPKKIKPVQESDEGGGDVNIHAETREEEEAPINTYTNAQEIDEVLLQVIIFLSCRTSPFSSTHVILFANTRLPPKQEEK